jgi:hypothetical protein
VIDGRHTFHDEDEAAVPSGWSCEQCGSTAFEVVVMVEEDPAEEPDDDYA